MTIEQGIEWFAPKQPTEQYYVQFDFTDVLGSATLTAATVSAIDAGTGTSVTSNLTDSAKQSVGSKMVSVWLKAWGTDGSDYKVSCLATASDGSKYELDAYLSMRAL
jgi:hypothetical protein